MDTFIRDLTYASRELRKNLGFAALATASWLPARRASRLDPMHAIREE